MVSPYVADFAEPSFARHETFHPRYGWLRKAVVAAEADPEVFTREDATVQLGVGKNMVNAIRHWAQAFKLIEAAPNPSRPRLPYLRPTRQGRAMFLDEGYDPYMEAPGTLWILHWWLLVPPTRAPVWWLALNTFSSMQFTEADLTRFVMSTITAAHDWPDVPESSVKRDSDCFTRMYAARRTGQLQDDRIDRPFRELRLIELVPGESRTYRFVAGPKPRLPDAVVAYASLEFMARHGSASTMAVARFAQDLGSPGRVFKLTEGHVADSLARFAEGVDEIHLADTAGVKQLAVDEDPGVLAQRALESYYHSAQEGAVRAGSSGVHSKSTRRPRRAIPAPRKSTAARLKRAST